MRGAVEGLGEHGQLLRARLAIFGVDGLIDAGNDDGGVAGVLAGSVDGVPVPGAIGQAGGGEQGGLGLAQGLVQLGEIAGWGDLQAVGVGGGGGEVGRRRLGPEAKSSETRPLSAALRLAASR